MYKVLPPRPRDFAVRVLMRHWPVQTLSAEDLRAAHPPLADLARHVQQQIKRRKQVGNTIWGKLKKRKLHGTIVQLLACIYI